jgi:murein DD-endopeptidase MepM/ murein hydrolase activator NlpD
MTEPKDPVRRPRTVALLTAITATLALLCCGGGLSTFLLGGLFDKNDDGFSYGCGDAAIIDPSSSLPRVGQFSDEQMRNAAIVISVGQQMKVPPRGWVVAVATAMQESRLINLGHLGENNDHDSLGLFQQRPSAGWGTPEQLRDPAYASRKFYEKLLTIAGWEQMALTDAAQRVQISAYPDAYAKHEPLATLLVNVLTDGAARAAGAVVDLRCVLAGEISAAGWVVPLRGAIWSGFRTPSRPTHQGVDLAAARGTPVHAAAAGVVVKVRCQAHTASGADWGCDRDGSPSIAGCGWYVDILHAGAMITRYCHMVTRPDVTPGQTVTAGQRIGLSGTSGRSSGPHLHFEVHRDGDGSSAGAIDPVQFMREVGAPLGDGTP